MPPPSAASPTKENKAAAGTVTDVMVRDNQMVKQGDVLFVVGKARVGG